MARKTIQSWLFLGPILLLASACSDAVESGAQPAQAEPIGKVSAPDADNKAGDYPAPIQALEAQGLEVLGTFNAPSGLTGYAGIAGGNPVSIYMTGDGSHALIGTLIDAAGNDAGAEAMRDLVVKPMSERIWNKLEKATWVQDGKTDAPRVIYTFTDANCPYCHSFWEAARPWVDAGKVQLRHVMVGVIRQDSANKAAAILKAASPEKALTDNERNQSSGGIKPMAAIPADVRAQLDSNERLMLELGFQGTPGILFHDEQGNVQRRSGMPQGDDLNVVLGPR
ncbi:thiol:disulfide interchange protein DsbG [Lysobacter sp. A03]|uniref:thiol:disulfide interchange protein DsbG n=1 Tax=Lysobacter sp. A03 TaxID=1199154 RepID=UPI0005B7522F|nr:thiol:disulfide interchange protein DsbG [Lysobacter sp. A03]KIQ96104.1 Thiol:disulfide interchange protein DsbG precursor [Lysobacter sp. A03]